MVVNSKLDLIMLNGEKRLFKIKAHLHQRCDYYLHILSVLVLSFLLFTCKENPSEFSLGEKYIESQSSMSLIDTFSVDLSTVIEDSVVTSGTGRLLIGNYSDNIFGKIESKTYFQIGIPDTANLSIIESDIYDSLNLVLRYNQYFYGDTTKNQKISVYQLTENIRFNDDFAITNNTSFGYNSNSIGSVIYSPIPKGSGDTLSIRLSDEVGRDLFTKLRDHSDILLQAETFRNYFHGLMLEPDNSYDGSIIGFNAGSAKLILHTRRNDITTEEIDYEFMLDDTTKQYNQITHDFSSSELNGLIKQQNKLSNSASGGLAFVQGGVGLKIRADFPSLNEILLRGRGNVVKAQLSITPLKGSYKEFSLPSELIIYTSNKSNEVTGILSYPISTLTIDELYQEETVYTFDITDYLTNELADSYVNPGDGLLISLPDTDLQTSLERLIIDSKNTKLKIYYLSY